MKQKLITILVAFGIAKAQAEKYLEKVDAPDEVDFDTEKFLTDFTTKQAELLKNDKDFVAEIQLSENKKVNDMWATKFKQATGLTGEEIAGKQYKDIIALGVERLRKKGDASTEELQQKNLELENKLKDIEDNVLPGKTTEMENFRKGLMLENKLEKMILSKKLAVSPTVASAAIKAVMSGKVNLELNESGELDVFQVGDGKLKVKKKDNTGFMTADDYITDILTTEKLIEVSGAVDTKTKTTTVVQNGGEEKKYSSTMQSNLDKASANLQEVTTNIEANSK